MDIWTDKDEALFQAALIHRESVLNPRKNKLTSAIRKLKLQAITQDDATLKSFIENAKELREALSPFDHSLPSEANAPTYFGSKI